MPTTNAPTKEKPKDHRQLLLDLIAKQYGSSNAVVMEKAFKTQDKQIEQAMLEGGTTADQVGKAKGVDLKLLDTLLNKGTKQKNITEQFDQQNIPSTGVQAVGNQPTQPTPQDNMGMSQTVPASSLFGRLVGLGDVNKKGQREDLGALWKVWSLLTKGNPNNTVSASEQESYLLNNQLKRMQINSIKNSGEIPTSEELLSQIPENEKEDYIVKPVKQTIRGMVNTVPILERKKTLPAQQLEDLGAFENTQKDLGAVVERLRASGLQLGPGFSTPPGAISDMLGQIKGKEFAVLKSDIGRNFQLYRKTTTGVAAGYPELNMLAPNYPKATDTNEVFIQKSIDVMKDIERNREIMLDYFGKGGYAVSQLRRKQEDFSNTKQYIRTGMTKDGKKVGQLPDGTIEVINE